MCQYYAAFINFPARPTYNDIIHPNFFINDPPCASEYTVQNFSGKNENVTDKPGRIYFAVFEGKLETKNLHKYCINIF